MFETLFSNHYKALLRLEINNILLLNFTIGLRLKDENENQAKREIEVDEANEIDSGEDDESEADLDEADYDSQCEKLNIFPSRLHC